MKSFKEICDYLIEHSVIDDGVYNLIDGGKELQKEINEIVYNTGNLSNDDSENDKIVERILLPRIRTIKSKIVELINNCGYDVSKITSLCDKVEYINGKNVDVDKKNEIYCLYHEFIIIRNGIWNYYQYMLRAILEKYRDNERYDDICQDAGMALMSAIEKYDRSNYNFKGFAKYYITYNVNYHYHDLDLDLKIPINKRHLYYKMHKTIESYVNRYHKMPTRDDLMRMLKITKRMLSTFLEVSTTKFIPLDEWVFQDDEYLRNGDICSDNGNIRQVEDMAIGETLSDLLASIFEELTDSERVVINDYYLADNSIDFGEITKKLGVSYGTTMNFRKRAFTKIRKHKGELQRYLR